jgi:uncharacterized membrane protein YjgN (DUF898 family)
LLFGLFYAAIAYLGGVARFRGLRYRLSRTWWHGIRGGSADGGWRYGGEFIGRHLLSMMTMFILFPWAATRLWNSRWNQMSFGSLQFQAYMTTTGLKRRWALLYAVPVIGMIAAAAGGYAGFLGDDGQGEVTAAAAVLGFLLVFYLGIPLATLMFFAKFYRVAAARTRLDTAEFSFNATSWQWFKLFVGNIALAVLTLGFGLTYWGYRNWSFMVRHLELQGAIDTLSLQQSTTRSPGEAEGFADAFDVGAI